MGFSGEEWQQSQNLKEEKLEGEGDVHIGRQHIPRPWGGRAMTFTGSEGRAVGPED